MLSECIICTVKSVQWPEMLTQHSHVAASAEYRASTVLGRILLVER